MNRVEEVSLADNYVAQYDAKQLTNTKDLIMALGLKWFRLNVLYKIKVKGDEDDENGKKPLVVRFRPNLAQRQRYINGHNRDIILKARQLGFTTFEMIDGLDECLFTANHSVGCIAHKEKAAQDIFRNKIKFAYRNIPKVWLAIFETIGLDFPKPLSDKNEGYAFSNGSLIHVGVSYRGDTLQHLHISEFGKICKKFPDKAEEVVTGAMEAVPINGRITIESTAEGNDGYFYDYTQEAQQAAELGRKLTELDFKFHFFPWYQDPNYTLNPSGVIVTAELQDYFSKLKTEQGVDLTPGQKAWYVKKEAVLKEKIKREYPSTAKEAFEQSLEGAYYAKQMAAVRTEKRIRRIPYDPRLPVHAFFDLGRNDSTAIWFMQTPSDLEYRFIRYYENSGESLQFYLQKMQTFGYVYGVVFLPHDAEVIELTRSDNKSRKDIVKGAGFKVKVVPRVPEKLEAIQSVRSILPLCWFDEENCAQGTKCLDSYRKEWDEKHGVWKDRPRHDWASHGNDAFEQFARGYKTQKKKSAFKFRQHRINDRTVGY